MRRLLTTLSVLVFSAVYANNSDAAPRHLHKVTDKHKSTHKTKKVSHPKPSTKKMVVRKAAHIHHSTTKKATHVAHAHSKHIQASNLHHTSSQSHKKVVAKRAPHSIAKVTYHVKSHKKVAVRHHATSVNESISAAYYAHNTQLQRSKQVVMDRLLDQLGKPYLWGGTSPVTGFDCSGLVYYAYKDIVKHPVPRTANEMFHFEHATSVKKSELQKGDLVFFKIHSSSRVADHVGVYLGNGKFIQSPRTGEDIRISYLDSNYWQNHYLGARRLITAQNVK